MYPSLALRILKINFSRPRYLSSVKYRTEEHAQRAKDLPRKATSSSLKLWALMGEGEGEREVINLLKGMNQF